MTSLRRTIATSDHPLARRARAAYRVYNDFTLPAPHPIVRPMLWVYLGGRRVVHFLRRVLIAEPLFKAYCTSYGRGVRTGIFVQWVEGQGEMIVGDYVKIWGKASFVFAARFADRPRLEIGDHSSIGHGVSITVAKHVRIGRHCHVAGGSPASRPIRTRSSRW